MLVSPFETQLTRETREGKANPSRNMWNGKPFRTQRGKAAAREIASVREDGAYRSSAPREFHPLPRRSVPA